MNAITKTIKSDASSSVHDILGPPALLTGESEEEYRALLDRVSQSVAPRDAIEAIYVRTAVDYLWEVQRYRRAIAHLINASLASGLWRTLSFLVPAHTERVNLVSQWARGEPEALQRVAELLGNAGLDEAHITANTIAALIKHLDFLTHQRDTASVRIDALFREIDRRRDGFARRLRLGLDEVEDAEVVDAEVVPSNGDLPA